MTEIDECTVSFTAEEADAGKRADVLAAEKAQITRSCKKIAKDG